MSAESLDIEPEPAWLELPLDPPRRDERDRRQVDEDQDDDEPPADVIVIELV